MASISSLLRDEKKPSPSKSPLFLRRRARGARPRRGTSTAVGHEMYCYLRWAQGLTAMTIDELVVNVFDRALADYFRRDSSWRSSRAHVLAKHPTSDWRQLFLDEAARAIESE
jgi:hypothetical protein